MNTIKITLFIILNLSFLIFNSHKAQAQYVTIPDANFRIWLAQNYPQCMQGNQMDTTCSAIVNASNVYVPYQNISDLTGIQYFDNLQGLYCSNNQLTSLNVSANTALTYLNCEYNQLTNLILSANTDLATLYCRNNQLTSLNLSSNVAITSLDCTGNQITSLNLSNNVALLYLTCDGNQLTNLNLSTNTAIIQLLCSGNQFTSLNLSANTALTYLSCEYNQLTNLILSANTALTTLYCRNNQLTSLNLSSNIALNTLNCVYNQLINLDLSANIALNTLFSQNNQLINLILPASTALTVLNCNDNQLTSLSNLPNNMLRCFIQNNNITCLTNLPQVTSSSFANISNNPLSCVPNQTNYSLGLPLCQDNDPINNPNNCQSVVNIAGNVFTDLNSNCAYNNTDLNIQNIPVKVYDIQNNLKQLSYTVNGVYSFASLPVDTYYVKVNDVALPIDMACGQSNTKILNLTATTQSLLNNDFTVVCDSAFDIEVHSVTRQGWVFPGQVHSLKTNLINETFWYNLNCPNTNYSGTVTITLTGPVTYVAPTVGALIPAVSGNIFTYNISNFNNITPTSFGLKLLTDTTAQVSNQICVHVSIVTTPTDADSTNNEYDFCYNVVNSYDPNMKEVYPVNVLPGYNDWFTYTIHFQNTGTAPAFNIRLRDTLDTQLDINTFEFLGASHTANTSLNGRNLSVRFNNIMLPDSTSNYQGSMGYYQYRIKPIQNLPNGTNIKNTAYIYFDYNPAIVTNTTENQFEIFTNAQSTLPQASRLWLFPNPSNGLFTFNDTRNLKTVEVFNIFGQLILSQGNAKQIDLSGFSKGIFFAKINGEKVVKLLKE